MHLLFHQFLLPFAICTVNTGFIIFLLFKGEYHSIQKVCTHFVHFIFFFLKITKQSNLESVT